MKRNPLLKTERADPWRIRLWRIAKSLTQDECARRMGHAGKHAFMAWSKRERYEDGIDGDTAQCMADALGVRLTDIMTRPKEWARNQMTYHRWVKDGRPDLFSLAAALEEES